MKLSVFIVVITQVLMLNNILLAQQSSTNTLNFHTVYFLSQFNLDTFDACISKIQERYRVKINVMGKYIYDNNNSYKE